MNTKLKILLLTLMMIFILSPMVFAASTIVPALSVIKIGQNVYIQPGQVVNSDAVAIGGDIYVNGDVNGSAVCIGGNIYVNGSVKGDVTCIGGNVNLGTQGKIYGKNTEIGKNLNIPFKYRNNYFRNIAGNYSGKGSIAAFVLLFVFSVIIYEVMPRSITKAAFEIQNNVGRNLLYGYVILIIIPIVTILLIATIIGILLLPILFLAAYVVFLIGFTSLSLYCGKRLGLTVMGRNLSDIWCLFIGAALYELIKGIGFLGIGSIISFLFIIPMAMGIALSTRFGTFRSWKRPDGDQSGWETYRK